MGMGKTRAMSLGSAPTGGVDAREQAGSRSMSGVPVSSLVALGVGIGCMWPPIHYSFYRYSIVGEGPIYALVLAVMALACVLAIALRSRLSAWLARRPVLVVGASLLTLAGNGLLLGLPYLPLPPGPVVAIRVAAISLYAATFVLLFFA